VVVVQASVVPVVVEEEAAVVVQASVVPVVVEAAVVQASVVPVSRMV
jgi:hypothetical protein